MGGAELLYSPGHLSLFTDPGLILILGLEGRPSVCLCLSRGWNTPAREAPPSHGQGRL